MTLLDYGAGNVRSLRNAIHLLGYEINDVSHVYAFCFLVMYGEFQCYYRVIELNIIDYRIWVYTCPSVYQML